ncbi:uncharacterized protein LOC132302350 [Cornus florida]|uniref:uncharacterized protein LOC132302350 n=1 Tax=Cornus florida TaxID=4283 RepID=UPI0028987567|nr:uncharacterized protein LOC132302350 [Cornus florida]
MACSRALTAATGLMKLLRPSLSPPMASPFPTRSLQCVALPTSAGSEGNSDRSTVIDLTKLLRSQISPQMEVAPFAARSFHTVALPTSVSEAKSDSLTTAIGLPKLLHSQLSPQTVTPFASRSLCTVAAVSKSGDSESDADLSSKQPSIGLKGVVDLVQTLVNDSYICVKIDVPGLKSKDLKIWVNEKRVIIFMGRSKCPPKYWCRGWFYGGTIRDCPLDCKVENFKAEVKNGVLWVTVPLADDAKKTHFRLLDQKGDEV